MSTDQIQAAPSTEALPRALRLRRTALRTAYGVLSLYALSMAPGVVLFLAGQSIPGWDFMFLASTVFKLLTLAAALPLAWTAGRHVGAARWLALGTAVWAVTEVLTAASRPLSDTFSGLLGAPVLWLGPWLLLAPERRRLLGRPPRPTVSLATVAAVPVAIGCLVWAAGNTGLAPRAFPTLFPPAEMLDDLRFDCAGLALALAVYSALAVLSRSVFPSPIVAAGSLAVAATALGWPNDLGSPGVVGGLALIAWSAVLACTRGRRRADPRAAGRSSTSLGRPSRPARPGR